jgi:hypothetical protein
VSGKQSIRLVPRGDDEARAAHYYRESARLWPASLDVLSWLGAASAVRGEVYEGALPWFRRAAALQLQEPKWALMVASCYRRIGGWSSRPARHSLEVVAAAAVVVVVVPAA